MKIFSPKAQGGFSMIELVIAIVVGSIFIVSMDTVINTYVHIAPKDKNLILANSYAEGKVESLRNIGYNGLTLGTTDISSELPADLSSPKSASMQITNPSAGIKQVDISVTYYDQGINRTYSYRTYIGELGVGQ